MLTTRLLGLELLVLYFNLVDKNNPEKKTQSKKIEVSVFFVPACYLFEWNDPFVLDAHGGKRAISLPASLDLLVMNVVKHGVFPPDDTTGTL